MATYKYNTLATTLTVWQTSTGSTVEVGYKLTEETAIYSTWASNAVGAQHQHLRNT